MSTEGETGLFSYTQILRLLKIEFDRARRYQYDLSLVLVEIDRLAALGDVHGFSVRDRVEDVVGGLLNRQSRTCDFVGQLGERFIVLLPHTDAAGAQVLAKRLHDRIGELDIRVDDRALKISASVAVASEGGEDSIFFDAILKRAEGALDALGRRGGDGVTLAGEQAADERS